MPTSRSARAAWSGTRKSRSAWSSSRPTPGSPGPLEAGLEALAEIAALALGHCPGDADGASEQLLLGTERARPLVIGARDRRSDRDCRVGQDGNANGLIGAVGLPAVGRGPERLAYRVAVLPR